VAGVVGGRGHREWLFGNIAVEGHLLTTTQHTSLLRPITAPFFLALPSSKKDLRRYLLEEGETVRHLVKSDLEPYPILAPCGCFWRKSPP
jgi:hypothetical protein